MGRIEGKVAIITGAAAGIGVAAARRFVAEGAKVFLVDRDENALALMIAEFPSSVAAGMRADVTDEADTRAFVAGAVARFGRVDIALLNAGIGSQMGRIQDVPVSVFDQVMAVNVRSVWLGLAAVMPHMRAHGGSIVITSSVAGLRGAPMQAAYNASKHAAIGLMKSAALDGAKDRIRVNAVNPAQTHTGMMEAIDLALDAAGRVGDRTARIPMGRYGAPAEVASLMLFLASDESGFCTGSTYLIDGGAMS